MSEKMAFGSVDLSNVALLPSLFADRFELNRRYLLSLEVDALLQSHVWEAGLGGRMLKGEGDKGLHWGWEAPSCHLRGHFLGHWMSAAAKVVRLTEDPVLSIRLGQVVEKLHECQRANGGRWVGSIPEKYLQWISGELPKQYIWAPHYTLHKTLMGLVDTYRFAGNEEALEIAIRFADWFHAWTAEFDREQMDDILDVETGGMLETWADLYGITADPKLLDLIARYRRGRLFDPLLSGVDMLTNMHANTTIPEVLGAARAYEVTQDPEWRSIAEAYWRWAVDKRGTFCTGGQTTGEVWTPPFEFASRLGDKNQEHCTVYNMVRLADYLFRWTGESKYADYIERNLWNGVLAQQNPRSGMVAYFLPLEPGAKKEWGHPTRDFWCCHGTLVQVHTLYAELAWSREADGLALCQFIPSTIQNGDLTLKLTASPRRGSSSDNSAAAGYRHRPGFDWYALSKTGEWPDGFQLKIRVPDWADGDVRLFDENGTFPYIKKDGWIDLGTPWSGKTLSIEIPKRVRTMPIPDRPEMVAFLDGPVVLAGLTCDETTLESVADDPSEILVPDNEREWGRWLSGYKTIGQAKNIRFKPLHEVQDETYTVYFPIR